MSIEIRQMHIKSTVQQEAERERYDHTSPFDPEEIKAEILAQCRRLIREALRDEKER